MIAVAKEWKARSAQTMMYVDTYLKENLRSHQKDCVSLFGERKQKI